MDDRIIMERMGPRGPEEQRFDREFWRRVGHEGRFAAAWQMVVEANLIRGRDAGESRLQRSVQTVKRREG